LLTMPQGTLRIDSGKAAAPKTPDRSAEADFFS
jgi:hypothetical protein